MQARLKMLLSKSLIFKSTYIKSTKIILNANASLKALGPSLKKMSICLMGLKEIQVFSNGDAIYEVVAF